MATPAIPYDFDKALGRENHFISSAFQIKDRFFLTSVDFTSGSFFGSIFNSFEELFEKIQKISPKEFITSMGQWDHHSSLDNYFEEYGILKTHLSEEYFEAKRLLY